MAETQKLKPRLQQLVDLLPKHDWVIAKAAVEVGYSKSYAEKRLPGRLQENVSFCRALDAKRQEFTRATGWDVEKWRSECIQRYKEAVAADDRAAVCQLLKMLGQNTGAFEADNRQRNDQIAIVMR
jgi:ubiquinone biosynthesis protein COQ9